jgi:hypothetical protein
VLIVLKYGILNFLEPSGPVKACNGIALSLILKYCNLPYTIILPVVLYGCEIWSLTLREERRLRVFENRVLRRIFGPNRDEETS